MTCNLQGAQRMRPIACWLAAALPLGATACSYHYPIKAEITEDRHLDAGDLRKLEVKTRGGGVQVRCRQDAAEVAVHVTRFARGTSDEDARRAAERIEVVTARDETRSDVLRLVALVPSDIDDRSPGASFEVEMPPGADIEVHTSNGRIGVEGARGQLLLKTSNGRVEVREAEGDAVVRSSNGAVVVREVRGSVDLETSNGAIEIDRVTGARVAAHTSNGRITAEAVDGEPSLETSNGSITLRASRLPPAPKVKAVTSNGSVLVEVPAGVGARLSLRTANGRISQRLDGVEVRDLDVNRHHVRAVLNGGGGTIDVRTSNGAITFQTTP